MKLLLAVYDNNDALENYFLKINEHSFLEKVIKDAETLNNIKNYLNCEGYIEVCCCVRHRKNLLDNILKYEPDTIILSHTLPGEDNMNDIISKITSSKEFPSSRIIYLYGSDDSNRKEFISFLISNGVFDYYVGESLSPSVINDLLINKKTRDDVKADILSNYKNQLNDSTQNDKENSKLDKNSKNTHLNVGFLIRSISGLIKIISSIFQTRDKPIDIVTSDDNTNDNEIDNKELNENELELDHTDISVNRKKDKKRIISNRKAKKEINNIAFNNITMVISVSTLKSGIGCTHISKSLAYFIKHTLNKSVCIVDMKGSMGDVINGIEVYNSQYLFELYDKYNYIIIDAGIYDATVQKEIKQSHIKILGVIPDDEYFMNLSRFIIENDKNKKWKYIFNHVPKDNKKLIRLIDDRMEKYEYWCMPVNDGMYFDDDMKAAFYRILTGGKL